LDGLPGCASRKSVAIPSIDQQVRQSVGILKIWHPLLPLKQTRWLNRHRSSLKVLDYRQAHGLTRGQSLVGAGTTAAAATATATNANAVASSSPPLSSPQSTSVTIGDYPLSSMIPSPTNSYPQQLHSQYSSHDHGLNIDGSSRHPLSTSSTTTASMSHVNNGIMRPPPSHELTMGGIPASQLATVVDNISDESNDEAHYQLSVTQAIAALLARKRRNSTDATDIGQTTTTISDDDTTITVINNDNSTYKRVKMESVEQSTVSNTNNSTPHHQQQQQSLASSYGMSPTSNTNTSTTTTTPTHDTPNSYMPSPSPSPTSDSSVNNTWSSGTGHSPYIYKTSITSDEFTGCSVCGREFGKPSALRRHMRTHTGTYYVDIELILNNNNGCIVWR
jgi:hypothetical protein